ncbi:MAG: aldehyde dehydrogenase family protein [Planctomycetota bacterium]
MSELDAIFAGPIPPEFEQPDYELADAYLIGGEIKRWDGPTTPVLSVVCEPDGEGGLTRRVIGHAAELDADCARAALAAACAAWDRGRGEWPRMRLAQRAEAVRAFAARMRTKRDEVVRLLMWEIGKTLGDARKEFDRTLEYIDDTLAAISPYTEGDMRCEGGVVAQVRRSPIGVCLCMGPFNYPLNENFTTLIPALLMGNTAVVKLPKFGQLSNLPLLEDFAACFPPGVVNVLQGDGATLVGPLMQSGLIDVFAFIGSSRVAGIIEKQHPAPYRLHSVLGMDAKNPAIVLESANLDLAVDQVLQGSLSFNGQRCTALKLIFVHRSLADAFVERLAAQVDALVPGLMWQSGVSLTPLPEPHKAQTLDAMVQDAVRKGARVVNARGGQHLETFYFPAVLYPVAEHAVLYDLEQFGPLVPVVPFDDPSEVWEAISASSYGQQVSVFGEDPDEVGTTVDALANQVCRINVNRQCQRGPDTFPFAGRKNSAIQTLSVTEALEVFSIPLVVAASDVGPQRALFEQLKDTDASRVVRGESG